MGNSEKIEPHRSLISSEKTPESNQVAQENMQENNTA